MSKHQDWDDDGEALVPSLKDSGEATGGGWIGCCAWFCLLGGIPMLFLFFPAGLGLVVLGCLLLSGKPTIDKAEEDMHQAVHGKGVTPETVGWLARTSTIGCLIIVGAFVVAVWLMLAVR